MGAPNIENWIPDSHSIIRTDKYANARALANHVLKVAKNEELYNQYFKWKENELSPVFLEKLQNCPTNQLKCRICEKVLTLQVHFPIYFSHLSPRIKK
jgi:hypothetical protein